MKTLTELLHTLYCTKTHCWELERVAEMRKDESVCLYHLESMIVDSWSCRDHKKWEEEAKSFLSSHKLTESEALQLISELLELLRKLEGLENRYNKAKSVFIELLSTSG